MKIIPTTNNKDSFPFNDEQISGSALNNIIHAALPVCPEGNDLKLDIDFEKSGKKRLMAKFANLEIL